jgi:hypothetical protein
MLARGRALFAVGEFEAAIVRFITLRPSSKMLETDNPRTNFTRKKYKT